MNKCNGDDRMFGNDTETHDKENKDNKRNGENDVRHKYKAHNNLRFLQVPAKVSLK